VRSHPGDLLAALLALLADGSVDGGKIRVFEQLSAISAQSLDVLIIGLLQTTLQTAIHRPIPNSLVLNEESK